MTTAVSKLQRNVFVILLYVSAVYPTIFDELGITNRTSMFMGLDIAVYFLALFSLSTIPKGFGQILLVILGGIAINFSYAPVSMSISLNGVRETLVIISAAIFFYKVFSEGNEEEQMRYVRIMKTFGWFFLLVQIIPVAIQYKQYGPTDYVGGTYGWLSTGNLTLIIICIVFFLFQFPNSPGRKLLLFALMYPLMLNETKVSFLLIPMLVIFLFFEPKLKNLLLAGAAGVLFLLLFNNLYSNDADNMGKNISEIFNKDFLTEYLMADPISHPDVPRFTKFILGYNLLSQQMATLLFGFEFGMFRGTGSGEVSNFAQMYSWLLSGTRPYGFILFMQGGLVLLTAFILMILKICHFMKGATKHVWFYFIIFLVILLYAESFKMHNFLLVFMFMLFFVNSDLFKSKAYLHEDPDSNY